VEHYGRVDGPVNNAGIEAAAFTADLAEPAWVLTIAAASSRSELAAAQTDMGADTAKAARTIGTTATGKQVLILSEADGRACAESPETMNEQG
jgi:NAD(P)-dependent dehydrogenase (short-subunit alcohol dehydrogenase family)